MGGSGSTRWGFHSKRRLIEDSHSLGAYDLMRYQGRGLVTLTWRRGDREAGSIGAAVHQDHVWLIYTVTPHTGTPRSCHYSIELQTTPTPWGALRYWFTCPRCGRRVGKVYLPPGDHDFACRRCHKLAYRSNQEQHEFDRLYRIIAQKMGIAPELVREVLRH